MKNVSMLRRTVAIAGLILGISLGLGPASAQNLGNPGVLPPNSNAFGRSYAEWSAAWWQWLLSIPADTNPNFATGNVDCTLGQSGHVWFLAGTFGGSATRKCTIPTGKALFFPLLNTVFGAGVGDCTGPSDCNITALRQAAAAAEDDPQLLQVSIDNVPLENLDQYRVASPVFNAFFPEGNIPGNPPGTYGPLVADGYWVLLAPLSRGAHKIYFKGVSANGFTVDVTYVLTVSK
jgi:hypothetical protein